MGTKLEYAANLLPASSKQISIVDEWGACLKTQSLNKDNSPHQTVEYDVQNVRHSMDRRLNELRSFESIKNAMLQHDHLFKQQVKELHRLYSLQKMLMTDLANRHHDLPTPVSSSTPDCLIREANGQNLTNRQGFALEQAAYEDKEADVELTLSIGNMKNSNDSSSITKPQQQPRYNLDMLLSKSSSDQTDVKLQEEDCSNTTLASDQARKKRPHWLCHNLSLHNN